MASHTQIQLQIILISFHVFVVICKWIHVKKLLDLSTMMFWNVELLKCFQCFLLGINTIILIFGNLRYVFVHAKMTWKVSNIQIKGVIPYWRNLYRLDIVSPNSNSRIHFKKKNKLELKLKMHILYVKIFKLHLVLYLVLNSNL